MSDAAHLDHLLDEALAATFPASDPVAISTAGNEEPLIDSKSAESGAQS